jgi:hypothetical protein
VSTSTLGMFCWETWITYELDNQLQHAGTRKLHSSQVARWCRSTTTCISILHIQALSSISRLVRGKPDDIWTIWSVTLTHCLTIAATRCHRMYRLGNLPAIQGSALHPTRFFCSLYSKIVKSATWGARLSKREIGLEKPVVCSRPSKSAFDLS